MTESILPAEMLSTSSTEMNLPTSAESRPREVDSRGFRIKKAVNFAIYFLVSTLGMMALAAAPLTLAGISFTSGLPAAIIGTAAIVAGAALSILLFGKIWQFIEPHMPNFIRIPINYLHSSICGVISQVALMILSPLNLEKKNPVRRQCDPTQTPILMIHGFLGCSSNWVYHRYRLWREGYKNLFTVNLGNPFLSIDDYADKVQRMVLKIQHRTGRKDIQFICHSMGGLVARQYHEKHAQNDGAQIKDLITLGTPLDGTKVAWLTLGLSRAGREMYPKSHFVVAQQKFAKTNSETRYTHIASKCDCVIRPLVSAVANGGASHVEEQWLNFTGHLGYLFSDAAADAIIRCLKGRNNSRI